MNCDIYIELFDLTTVFENSAHASYHRDNICSRLLIQGKEGKTETIYVTHRHCSVSLMLNNKCEISV